MHQVQDDPLQALLLRQVPLKLAISEASGVVVRPEKGTKLWFQ